MKRLIRTLNRPHVVLALFLLSFAALYLSACSSVPEPPLFAGHDAPKLTGWVMHRMSDGSVHMDPKFDGVPYHGVHALGDGPDIWNAIGQDAVAVNLDDE